ncbi:hypothetical protein [Kibdelosporangium phytohabitans]|uniref:Uncharacterized protein n=1 Tax=Kibdelosporangium phytohabitans TaxID=860235 RepID=A0A0N9I678_9PSEU|nr:hypothetical protein [Kibdelosporangium phytohabitans]ALG10385.1 hypothetical protein AOZ06_28955 [Kibdelosporangium phytohabitans]MBE1461441.1 hypothetical protein [Kibdelosporangium phytohabitans]
MPTCRTKLVRARTAGWYRSNSTCRVDRPAPRLVLPGLRLRPALRARNAAAILARVSAERWRPFNAALIFAFVAALSGLRF